MVVTAVMLVVLPVLHLALPADHALHVSSFWITLFGKFMCYAVVALAMDLIWGYTGILSLGQGLFFALGGYAFGMYLMRQIGRDGVYQSELPDFMVFLDWKELPWYWAGSDSLLWSLFLVVAVPGLLAFVFGFFAFRSRIKGVYFSIITQALTFAAMLAFFRNDMGFGGNNGFTDFKRIAGFPITAPETRTVLYVLSGLYLLAALAVARWIVQSKLGRVLTAIRDQESRLLFLGYRTLWFKLFVWTVAAVMSGIAGALYVPQVGIINPSEMSPANSIEIAIWAAVGGRVGTDSVGATQRVRWRRRATGRTDGDGSRLLLERLPGRSACGNGGDQPACSLRHLRQQGFVGLRIRRIGVDALDRADDDTLRFVMMADAFGAARRIDHIDRLAHRDGLVRRPARRHRS